LVPVRRPLRPADDSDRDSAQIHTTLRAFYFNLAHQDWEAMAADILPAKVVRASACPEALVLAATSGPRLPSPRRPAGSSPESDELPECSSESTPLVDRHHHARRRLGGGVRAACTASRAGEDEFRLIHFEQRWRFVYIDLEKGVRCNLEANPPVVRRNDSAPLVPPSFRRYDSGHPLMRLILALALSLFPFLTVPAQQRTFTRPIPSRDLSRLMRPGGTSCSTICT